MTCIICGLDSQEELCPTCCLFFAWRYWNDGQALESMLQWFRNGGEQR